LHKIKLGVEQRVRVIHGWFVELRARILIFDSLEQGQTRIFDVRSKARQRCVLVVECVQTAHCTQNAHGVLDRHKYQVHKRGRLRASTKLHTHMHASTGVIALILEEPRAERQTGKFVTVERW